MKFTIDDSIYRISSSPNWTEQYFSFFYQMKSKVDLLNLYN